ncbi:MAG: 30S ribosomal protein S4 [Bacteroidetes bacterium]|jgi:small subunit ribosomal protein S4|nr:MAG: 30S ribosomal protein S4 [Cryomorphaceae bacterium BACL11 MAG-121001-bin54]KRO63360.1 MAG: 30S ribosomal protein S4 [Cryomorphaceae bacterium BACL11 MAG-121015-bin20]MBC8474375.1 30S ribosomal protein S4 [Cryomorphaceae bacterium]MDA0681821.1 30S ribosomal protein S4 [Bacteroidota bacterium]KRO54126.1 MAG: 30S ribosomal protein S4 [Cryomorphaceae bacterium BACL11 MAG-121001-bin54]
MARYTGPTSRIARRFGEPIFGPDKALAKKAYGPGQHGSQKRRGKESAYGVQLMEKQKAKFTYGILEKQFSNLFKEALRRKGVTGENLLRLCEMRLDNVVFRLGIAPTRRAARQLVTHNHITVNGENINIPSYELQVGDLVSVRERSKLLEVIATSVSANRNQMEWLEFNSETKVGKVIIAPERIQIPENIKEQVIVELYSK